MHPKIVTVVHHVPRKGVQTKVFDEVRPALEYARMLVETNPNEHTIEVWDTGYKVSSEKGNRVV